MFATYQATMPEIVPLELGLPAIFAVKVSAILQEIALVLVILVWRCAKYFFALRLQK
jgi:hypothetical protein